MHRRPLGAGRRLAGLASIVIIAACFLPWWQTSNELGLPPTGGNAFDGSGVIVFFVALAVIALLALPYAAGDVPVGLDRPLSFVILVIVGWIALAIRLANLALANLDAVFPQRAYGLWLAAVGLILLSRAAYDITRDRRA
jgi:predicted membrane channel-forming protein YqfA (hemolysin III family)